MLGESTIELTIIGCSNWKLDLIQNSNERTYTVPSQLLELKVANVEYDGETLHKINEVFAKDIKRVDLREVVRNDNIYYQEDFTFSEMQKAIFLQ